MDRIPRPLSVMAVGAILLMAAALAADVAVNSTNIDLTGYADIVGPPPASSDAVLEVRMTGTWPNGRAGEFFAVSTGTAVWAHTDNGRAVHARSADGYGVWGESTNSWGGYFSSTGGYGVRVESTGNFHYDHGAYITSDGGYAVYAQSQSNQGVRGEAGDVTGISRPVGPVGVAGIGSNRGMYGSSGNGSGVYGSSDGNYGMWGQSATWRGITGRTTRSDNNYGLYTPDNVYSLNYNLLGAVMQVAHNGGGEQLRVGDVVTVSGILTSAQRRFTDDGSPAPSAFNDQPVLQVTRTSGEGGGLVAGVVFSRYNLDAVDDSDLILYDTPGVDDPLERFREAYATEADREINPAGPVGPGEYLLVVLHGPAQVRADATDRGIAAGDRLALGAVPGRAVHAAAAPRSAESAGGATVFGAALEPVVSGEEMIWAFVSPR